MTATRSLAALVLGLASGMLGCPTDPAPEPPPPMPVAACGMDPYELVDAEEVGLVLDWDPVEMWDLSPEDFATIVSVAGFEQLSVIEHDVRMVRFRYTTQDRGQVVEATATLTYPDDPSLGAEDAPVVLNIHGTSGWSDPCAPTATVLDEYNAIAAYFAGRGFLSVNPDHIGMAGFGGGSGTHHAYLHGEQIAVGSWDAVRAAQALLAAGELDTDLRVGDTVSIWGASQGGHGALLAERYAPYYAPEFAVPGVVAAVPPVSAHYLADLDGTTGSLTTATILAASLATQSAWYGLGDLGELLTDDPPHHYATAFLDEILDPDECADDRYPEEGAAEHEDLFLPGFLAAAEAGDWGELEPWGCFVDHSGAHTTSVAALRQTPTLTVFGELDPVVPYGAQQLGLEALCDEGASVEVLRCIGAPHVEAPLWSVSEQIGWFLDRLDGAAPDGTFGGACVLPEPVCCSGTPADICVP